MRSWLDGQAFSQGVGVCQRSQRVNTLSSFKLKPILHYAFFLACIGSENARALQVPNV